MVSNLVAHFAVGRDPVGAYNNAVDFALALDVAGHAVGNDGDRNFVFHQLPGSKTSALEEWPRFIGITLNALSGFHCRADHSQRSSESGRGQRAGVAVGENPSVAR